ncbi:DUF3667 domain-containing protein [Aurantiacibacter zhengii]|uniref:DUF3667 domain-containing protein n=1 Tax=Aurantiacibacter zhengii TaxID=2307003 RepID=A0A418NMR6_9SPHN|nr:DUF3667 domain-containing protein [Aurantiacibacter zhengii]RIV82686.1 DUF3667 domain-containing protein [Aurantiacibacter zhengii]
MSDIFDGIGTAAEGGLFARALEPDSGAKTPHPHQPARCLNCDTELTGAYCHACGQQGHIHRTIGAFMHDLLHGALHFEGKFWHTLPLLVFRPGQLTRRYIEGQRARFVSPMALFLFTVFLMFAVFQVLGITAPTTLPGQQSAERAAETVGGAAQAEIGNLREQLATGGLSDAEREEVEAELQVLESFVDNGAIVSSPEPTSGPSLDASGEVAPGEEAESPDGDSEPEPAARVDLGELTDGSTGVAWLDKAVTKWRDNPSLMLYKLQANAYKFSWLLIPISIPFVWLLFAWRRRFKAYDHAIFVTYSLSFITLLFVTLSLLGALGTASWVVTLAALLVPPIHLYKQLRYAYGLSRFSAFWRLMVLSVFIWIVIGLFLQLLFLLGAF